MYLDILKTEGKPAEMLADGLAAMADAVEDFDFDRAVELTSLYLNELAAPDKAAFWLNRFLGVWPNEPSLLEALGSACVRGAWRGVTTRNSS